MHSDQNIVSALKNYSLTALDSPFQQRQFGAMILPKKIMLLGSGELGKEFTIAAQRMGCHVIAVDSYLAAPAMTVAQSFEVISMLDGNALDSIVKKHRPDIIVPEVEAIRTEKLKEFEQQGIQVVPTAKATHLTMNRDAIRDLASRELGLKTARYAYADNKEAFLKISKDIGFPNVVKPVMSSSGKGQSTVKDESQMEEAWNFAIDGSRGDTVKVIVEEFIPFNLEITLLTVRQMDGPTVFVAPIGHRQERGDYQESWIPADLSPSLLEKAQKIATTITDALGGSGLFGVEFFIQGDEVYFSELSPRPHDTGMVTMISQNLSEFDLHLRAILGLPIPSIDFYGPSASHVILADKKSPNPLQYKNLQEALIEPGTDVRIFGKPSSRVYRRMGVFLARGDSTQTARKKAEKGATTVKLQYHE